MYLKSIELSGFKSFAKKSLFDFSSKVSAVVGPNGSGKSNVAEAFRFALGEQSMKSLRGKRGEDLIFNGAGSEARSNRATVKVVFDNSDKVFGIDFPEVVIERVVHRDGVNEYVINGSTVRLKDVIELLAKAHVGASGHHIISQGEADRILSASEKERKAMVEDALGLKIYEWKRLESERKLEKTFENIAQVESLRKEIAPHLKFLKKQAEKIEKAENLREELLKHALEYFKREEIYLREGKERLTSGREPIEEALKKLRHELDEAKRVLESSSQRGEKEYKILDLEKEIHSLRVHKDELLRKLGKIEGRLSSEERILKREEELAASEENKTVRIKDLETLYEEVSLYDNIGRILEKLKNFISELRHTSAGNALHEAKVAIEELVKEKSESESKLRDDEKREEELSQDYERLKKEVEKDKDSSRDAEKAVFRIMSEENELLGKRNALDLEGERLKSDDEEFKRMLAETGALLGAAILRYREQDIHEHGERKAQEESRRELERRKIRLEETGVTGADEVLKEFRETSERDEFLERELLDLEKSAESLKNLIKDLEERLRTEFAQGLAKINKEFSKFFLKMFGGGEASLKLVKLEKSRGVEILEEGLEMGAKSEIEEGLDVSVSLPRKKVRNLLMLSGGERALTSIALLFAIATVNPPPFIILDETDAALDEANSKKYGDLIEELSKHSQLIIITHNRETMSRAGVIYGVTMGSNGVSKLLSISFDEASAVAK